LQSQFYGTILTIPNDPQADNSNDLLDFPTYDGGVDSYLALNRMTDIIPFPKKRRKKTLAKALTWPNATADLVHTGTTSEVVTQ
jgi:hypothetical protein